MKTEVTLKLDNELLVALEAEAIRLGITMEALINQGLTKELLPAIAIWQSGKADWAVRDYLEIK
ncbi:hypothetical protein CLI64_13640 [Nostoc sp. CENA543]|uniref:hypothetical protein n=1 Tax=Nostoc sp. CENA543 TaxID=1869241 RepID=UPI000CA2EB7A|nr:hypothetical protein [Nostoc sp. CENA543]AUT01359.1 hypothetical protein CLI64_13640 [Nostoc sp. CENA543]